jgi:hypothetical protein
MSSERMTKLAIELMKLGVSQAGARELLSDHDLDEIERQLAYLPYRKAKRPEGFIIDAVRKRYSAPKEFFYAANQAPAAEQPDPLDEDAQLPPGSPLT